MFAYGVVLAVVLAATAACGAGEASSGVAGGPPVTASPSPSRTELTIVVKDGPDQTTWRLTCDPSGGTHPEAERACRILAAHGAQALPPTPGDRACTEIYGGRQTATISGMWQGRPVQSSLSRENGCEIARWDLLRGLLPPGGV